MNSYKQSLYIGIIRVCANLAMLASVFIAMRQANRWVGWPSEGVFCLFFFGITIPAWLLAWRLTAWVRKTWPAEPATLVTLPKRGSQLVKWRVLDNIVISPSK